MYRCMTCGREWADEVAADNQLLCTRRCGGELALAERHHARVRGLDLGQLPAIIALPLADLQEETHPVVRLWRVCDVAEMLLRLATSIGGASLDGRMSDDVARVVASRIGTPTLYHWLQMAWTLA